MGGKGASSNDRLRTIWTPEMDRYFIDLLLQQVSRGNKFDDYLFSKRAWKQMTLLFSTKFNFQYEKDVLKNRYKTLRNLYKTVKKLINQEGFIWDGNHQMVTADNSVWDEYIKMNPNARTFRIKRIPYYPDLCLIYENKGIEEKGENELQYLPHLVETETVAATQPTSPGEGTIVAPQESRVDAMSVSKDVVDDSTSKKVLDDLHWTPSRVTQSTSNRTRTYWHPPMDRYFIDLMLEQLQKGNKIDGVFHKQAWIDMITSFNAKFEFDYDVDVLKNRYKTLRRQYNVIKNLLEMDGFAWDDTRQMVIADDYVWQDYIKTHTDARQFMTRPLPYYKDLCTICNDHNVGETGRSFPQFLLLEYDVQSGKFHGASQLSESPTTSASSGLRMESVQTGSIPKMSTQNNKRQSENLSTSAYSKKLRYKEMGKTSTCSEMTTAIPCLSDEKKDENANSISIEDVVKAVQALPNMDEDLVLDACDLFEDEMKAKTFMALDPKLRKKWLLRKLRP
ncbi:hypothetical protein K2173_025480 [Erythroxylum novogranatense]|uniref:Myb/SANT-like domain-containing protein n=1 Tax=Erythroxylum novogranatense TaxID=1862640 RepID=A0AAV8SB45_9ROSI|nr:hypothetical protein K2173_025480 [Erythroxylum novogranatense]